MLSSPVLRRGLGAAGLRVRILPRALMSVVSVMCCEVEVSATGRSLVQRSSADCGVSECNREASIMRRRWSGLLGVVASVGGGKCVSSWCM
jgi:hypothetical protein